MTQTATFQIDANDQSAKAAWDRQQQAINAVIGRIGQMEDKLAQAKQQQDTTISSGITKLASMAAGYVSIQGAISGVISVNQQMIDQADAAAIKYDELFRKINVQAGLRGLEGKAAQESVTNVAIQNASTIEEAAATSQQLAGAGFSTADATGGALDAMLKVFSGTGQAGTANAGQLTQSMTQFISAMGMDRTAENLERVAVAVQQSYKAGDLQLEDLTQIAAKSSGLAGKLTPEETLASFATIRETMGGEQASTALKIFGERVTGAGEDKTRMDLLQRMGIKPEQIDLVGENIKDVLDTMAAGIERLPEEQRAGVMQKFFGGEGASGATYLINNRNRIGYYEEKMGDKESFESDATEAQSGPAAQRRRLTLMKEKRDAERSQNEKNMLDAADITAQDQGISGVNRAISRAGANVMLGFGFSPETATSWAYAPRFGVTAYGSVGMMGTGASEQTASLLEETSGPKKKRTPEEIAAAASESISTGRGSAATPSGSSGEAKELRDAAEMMRDAAASLKKAAEKPVKVEKPHVPKTPVSAMAGSGGR